MSEDRVPESSIQEETVLDHTIPNPPANSEYFLLWAKILITVLFISPLIHYSMYGGDEVKETLVENITKTNNVIASIQENVTTSTITKEVKMRVVLPPFCPTLSIQTILDQLLEEYILNTTCCSPEDVDNEEKHKIPANSARRSTPSDPRANIVSFVTVGFLIVSLVATFLELYKAKKRPPAKTKAPLTRNCSLADLTILKHQRKELIRRDSILEGHEESKQPALHKKAPPLQRSSSTPVEPISELAAYNFSRSFDSRRCSIVDSYAETPHSRISLDGRRSSILDRRSSIIDGKFIDRFDPMGRRISVDITSSPERKHHSRLVHRH